jgi:hypothetical protein
MVPCVSVFLQLHTTRSSILHEHALLKLIFLSVFRSSSLDAVNIKPISFVHYAMQLPSTNHCNCYLLLYGRYAAGPGYHKQGGAVPVDGNYSALKTLTWARCNG